MKLYYCLLAIVLVSCSGVGNKSGNTRQLYILEPSIEAKNSQITGAPIMSIRRVRLPDYVGENKGLVRRDGSGKIRISSLHNWAEHLTTAIPSVLAMELTAKLKKPVDLHPIPVGYDIPLILEVDILTMLGGFNGKQHQFDFQAKYRLIGRQSLETYRFNTVIQLNDDKAESLVQANAQAIERLADDIADKVK